MKSLAKIPEKMLSVPEVSDGPYYPCVYVDGKQMPEIDDWEVGEEYTITVKVKVRSYTMSEDEKNERSSAELELIEYGTKTPKSLD